MATVAPPRPPVDFRDVRDPDGFVHATISRWQRPTANRGPIILSLDEREELVCEGMLILCKLARDYKPHMAGYAQAGRFSGYAAQMLPRKLGDAWHRLHPEHQLKTQPDGSRKWEYGERSVSFEAITEEDGDRQPLLADGAQNGGHEVESWLYRALWEDSERLIAMTMQVAKCRARSLSEQQIAAELGLPAEQVRERSRHIDAVIDDLRGGTPLAQALRDRADRQIELAVGVGGLMANGSTAQDAAEVLQLDSGIVRDCVLMIARVRTRLETFANGRQAA